MLHNLHKGSSHPQPLNYTLPKRSVERQQLLLICFWTQEHSALLPESSNHSAPDITQNISGVRKVW